MSEILVRESHVGFDADEFEAECKDGDEANECEGCGRRICLCDYDDDYDDDGGY